MEHAEAVKGAPSGVVELLMANGFSALSIVFGFSACRLCIAMLGHVSSFSIADRSVGMIAGLAVSAAAFAFARQVRPICRALQLMPSIGMCLCAAAIVICKTWSVESVPLLYVSEVSSCFCYAVLTVQWLERVGALPGKTIVIALASEYIVTSASMLFLNLEPLPWQVWAFASLVSAGACLALMRGCAVCPPAPNAPPANNIAMKSDTVYITVLVIPVFTAFGIATSEMNGVVNEIPVRHIGELLAGFLLLMYYQARIEAFDLRHLLGIAIPAVFIALASTIYDGSMVLLPSLAFYIGEAAAHIVVYALLLFRTFRYQRSSALACALISVYDWSVHALYTQFQDPIANVVSTETLLYAIFIVNALALAVLFVHELAKADSIDSMPGVQDDAHAVGLVVERLANEAGLTTREKTVLAYMSAGKTYAEISNLLFISQGTARSHASRVYEKLNVRSRRELEVKISTIRQQEEARPAQP